MNWANFFKMYVHAYDPVKLDDGVEIHINFVLMYPIQSFWYDLRRFGWNTAVKNFQTLMSYP